MSGDLEWERNIAVPRTVLDRLVGDIWNPVELKVVLTVAALGGEQHPVSASVVAAHDGLNRGLRGDGSNQPPQERIQDAISAALAHAALISLTGETEERWLVLASEENYRRARADQFTAPDRSNPVPLVVERPGIFRIYEQNIGLVTPIIADKLADAMQQYPEHWIADAIGEAVAYNRRNWRYIERILDNWSTEGRNNETNQRDHEEHVDSGASLLGKYAPLFRKR